LSNTERRRVRIVERLAQKMYEASEPGSILWLRRGWIVREAWLRKAQERLEGAGKSVDRLYAWWNVWGKMKILRL
jgi:threonyl-tRNA synthetase